MRGHSAHVFSGHGRRRLSRAVERSNLGLSLNVKASNESKDDVNFAPSPIILHGWLTRKGVRLHMVFTTPCYRSGATMQLLVSISTPTQCTAVMYVPDPAAERSDRISSSSACHPS